MIIYHAYKYFKNSQNILKLYNVNKNASINIGR